MNPVAKELRALLRDALERPTPTTLNSLASLLRRLGFPERPVPTEGGEPIWKTARGERIPISGLDDDHLLNCIKMYFRKGVRQAHKMGQPADDWLTSCRTTKILTEEAKRRDLPLPALPTYEELMQRQS